MLITHRTRFFSTSIDLMVSDICPSTHYSYIFLVYLQLKCYFQFSPRRQGLDNQLQLSFRLPSMLQSQISSFTCTDRSVVILISLPATNLMFLFFSLPVRISGPFVSNMMAQRTSGPFLLSAVRKFFITSA